MHEALQLEIHRVMRLFPVLRLGTEHIFRATPKASDMPGQLRIGNGPGDAHGPTLCHRNHSVECLFGKNFCESRAHRGKRKGIPCQSSSNAADVAILELLLGDNAVSNFLRETIRSPWNS